MKHVMIGGWIKVGRTVDISLGKRNAEEVPQSEYPYSYHKMQGGREEKKIILKGL